MAQIYRKIGKDIALINQKNQLAFQLALSRFNGDIIWEKDDVLWVTSPANTRFNNIKCILPNQQTPAEQLASVVQRIQAEELPNTMLLGPNSTPHITRELAETTGFVNVPNRNTALMSIELDQLKTSFPCPEGLVVKIIEEDELYSWGRAVGLSLFGITEEEVPQSSERFREMSRQKNARLFTAILDGVYVGASALFFSEGVAGLYAVGVLPGYQNRGIGKQIVLAPYLYARELGYKVGILQASAEGERVYSALGFQADGMLWSMRYPESSELAQL